MCSQLILFLLKFTFFLLPKKLLLKYQLYFPFLILLLYLSSQYLMPGHPNYPVFPSNIIVPHFNKEAITKTFLLTLLPFYKQTFSVLFLFISSRNSPPSPTHHQSNEIVQNSPMPSQLSDEVCSFQFLCLEIRTQTSVFIFLLTSSFPPMIPHTHTHTPVHSPLKKLLNVLRFSPFWVLCHSLAFL